MKKLWGKIKGFIKKPKVRMDHIHNEYDIYEYIFKRCAEIMILLVDFYVIFITNYGADFKFVQNPLVRVILQFVFQVVIFLVASLLIYALCYKETTKTWRKKHRKQWVQGEWLHIHDKKSVRVGYVNIRQRFSSIEVYDAVNVTPNVVGIQKKGKTKWGYQSAAFLTDHTDHFELLCCYEAKSDGAPKPGIHHFDECMVDDDGTPCQIKGTFSDTWKSLERSKVSKNDAGGDIYLYKITDKIRPFITDGKNIDYNKIANILDNEELKDEPFCIKLDEVIRKYGYTPMHEMEKSNI